MKIIKFILPIVIAILISGTFYWFQIRPSNIKQKELEEQVKAMQEEIDDKSKTTNYLYETRELERDINNLQYQIDDSLNETKRYLEDERNNQNNCERNGGRYQGDGFCVYY